MLRTLAKTLTIWPISRLYKPTAFQSGGLGGGQLIFTRNVPGISAVIEGDGVIAEAISHELMLHGRSVCVCVQSSQCWALTQHKNEG